MDNKTRKSSFWQGFERAMSLSDFNFLNQRPRRVNSNHFQKICLEGSFKDRARLSKDFYRVLKNITQNEIGD